MSQRTDFLKDLIRKQREMGANPCEIHCNSQTRAEFAQEANIRPMPTPDSRSLLERLREPRKSVEMVLRFENLPLIANDVIPGGGMLLRPQQLMGDPDWLRRIHWNRVEEQIAAKRAEMDGDTPWHQQEPVMPQDAARSGDGDVLQSLSDGGGINPTTVLLKAMENLDGVEDVVVLRFYRNKGIDLCSTMKRHGVIGALQDALGHVANGGD